MIEAHATAKYVRTSAQKAGLVLDLIRGRQVNDAFATLRFARKSVAHTIEKVLRSAVANAQQKEGFGGDVERLIVLACYANQGPSMKRVRPAPMGRAFRVLKRTAHLTVRVAELPRREAAVVPAGDGATTAPRKPKARSGGAKKTARTTARQTVRRTAGPTKSATAGAGAAKKTSKATTKKVKA